LSAILRILRRLLLVAPLIALFLTVLLDRAPDGDVRLSRFPLALLAVDSLVPTCMRNSAVFAAALALSSLGLGVALGWVLGRRSFWGRPLWQGAVLGLLAASPAILALGIVGLFGPVHTWPWPFANSGRTNIGVSLESWSGLGLWLAWLWSSLPAATALVAAAATSAVERLEPSWEDAARLGGASPFRAWRTVSWPLIRPPAARAAGLVFVLGLVEPGAPLILGLRRTLAFQIVAAARRPEPFPGVAAWCLLAALIAFVGAVALRRLGGAPILSKTTGGDASPRTDPQSRRASPIRTIGSIAILATWCSLAWLPVLGLARLAIGAGDPQSRSESARLGLLGVLASRVSEPPVRRLLVDSALVGLEFSGAILALFALAKMGRRVPGGLARSDANRRPSPIIFAPPLIVGVGVLAIPRLAEAAAGWLPHGKLGSGLAGSLAILAGSLAPNGTASLFLPLSMAWALGPWLLVSWHLAQPGSHARAAAMDAARLAGASRFRALWLGAPSVVAIWIGRLALAWSLAATNLTPALLASPGTDGPTVAPGVVFLADGPPEARGLAADLALGILVLDVAALTVAWACGALPRLGDCEPR